MSSWKFFIKISIEICLIIFILNIHRDSTLEQQNLAHLTLRIIFATLCLVDNLMGTHPQLTRRDYCEEGRMKQIKVSRQINASIHDVWPMLANIHWIHKIHPMVESSPIVSDCSSGVGATRVCKLYNGIEAVERVSRVVEKQVIVIDIVESKMPFRKAYGEFYTKAIDDNRTLVDIHMYLTPKFGWIGSLLYALLFKRMFKNMLENVLKGLENHLTTGKIVGKNGVLLDAPTTQIA